MKKTGFLVLIFNFFILIQAFPMESNPYIDLYNQGADLFQQAVESAVTNSEEAEFFYKDSLLRFLQISKSVQNGKLLYNIGNIYFQLGDIGRAILSYRKAELLIPGDRNLKENLAVARAQRVDTLNEKESVRILETIFFIHYNLSASIKTVIFGITLAIVWISASLILLKMEFSISLSRIFFTSTIIFSALAFIFLGSVLLDTYKLKNNPGGVITADAIIARRGDGLSYSPSFQDPLHSGLEFTLVNKRQGWYFIELSDNTRTWIPDNTASLVLLE